MDYLLPRNYSQKHTHKQWAASPWAVKAQLLASPPSLNFYCICCNQYWTIISTILKTLTALLSSLHKQTVMWYQISSSKLASTAVPGTRSTAVPAWWDQGAQSCVSAQAQPPQMSRPIYSQRPARASSFPVHQIPFAKKIQVHYGTICVLEHKYGQ